MATKEEVKDLLSTYDLADQAWMDAKKIVEEKEKVRSDAVKAIALAIAPVKRLVVNGRELTIVIRGETYFFRGAKKDDKAFEV